MKGMCIINQYKYAVISTKHYYQATVTKLAIAQHNPLS